MDDLSLISSEDLIQELFKRHDAVLVARYTNRSDEEEAFLLDYYGMTICIGLAARAQRRLLDIAVEQEEREE